MCLFCFWEIRFGMPLKSLQCKIWKIPKIGENFYQLRPQLPFASFVSRRDLLRLCITESLAFTSNLQVWSSSYSDTRWSYRMSRYTRLPAALPPSQTSMWFSESCSHYRFSPPSLLFWAVCSFKCRHFTFFIFFSRAPCAQWLALNHSWQKALNEWMKKIL
jgi:hypothetical protein